MGNNLNDQKMEPISLKSFRRNDCEVGPGKHESGPNRSNVEGQMQMGWTKSTAMGKIAVILYPVLYSHLWAILLDSSPFLFVHKSWIRR